MVGGGARISDFFKKNSNVTKKNCKGGEARVSEFFSFLLRIQI